MIRYLQIALAAFIVSGCATDAVKPVQIVTVDRPVTVHCVKASDIPAKPAPVAKPDGDARQLAAGISADLRAMDGYADQLRAIIDACAEQK